MLLILATHCMSHYILYIVCYILGSPSRKSHVLIGVFVSLFDPFCVIIMMPVLKLN